MSDTIDIALVMTWTKAMNSTELNTLEYWDEAPESARMMVAKAMQQKMVDDGWHVHIYFVKGQPVQANAFHLKHGKRLSQDKNDEESALVALFCKCYGIKEE